MLSVFHILHQEQDPILTMVCEFILKGLVLMVPILLKAQGKVEQLQDQI
jgi:hypothetical protein